MKAVGLGRGELDLLCSSSEVLGQSSEEVWNWNSPSELSLLRKGGRMFVPPHWPIDRMPPAPGRVYNLEPGSSLRPRTVSGEGPSSGLALSAVNSPDSLENECLCALVLRVSRVGVVGDDSCQYTTVSNKIYLLHCLDQLA